MLSRLLSDPLVQGWIGCRVVPTVAAGRVSTTVPSGTIPIARRSPGRRTRRARRRGRRGSRGRRGRRSADSATAAQWSRPRRTGWPGSPSYAARASTSGPVAGGEHPAYDVGPDVRQVDQRDQRRPRRRCAGRRRRGRRAGRRPCPRPSRSATTTADARCRPSSGSASRRLGAEHDGHRRRSRRRAARPSDAEQPRGAVVVADQRLRHAHPGAGAGGEQQSVQVTAQPRRAGRGQPGTPRRRAPASARRVRRAEAAHHQVAVLGRGDQVAPALLEGHRRRAAPASARLPATVTRSVGSPAYQLRRARGSTSAVADRGDGAVEGDAALGQHLGGRHHAPSPCTASGPGALSSVTVGVASPRRRASRRPARASSGRGAVDRPRRARRRR